MIHLTECPRDAMQGIHEFIPTQTKVEYIKSLINAGFPVIDAGSFVSPKAIPQMADSADVFKQIGEPNHGTELLAIVANARGANDAVAFENISYLGFPFSVSETFQQRNANSSIEESLKRVEEIFELTEKTGKKLMIYLSMAFGNPYGDHWDAELVTDWANKLASMGINYISLADTIGISDSERITSLFSTIIPALPHVQVSAHLHARPEQVYLKTEAAYKSGCRHFDAALKGFGGCPMASDNLTGNMATETVLTWCEDNQIETGINRANFNQSMGIAANVFSKYH
jgi:hydroxymethylglutaryl-CoA lyase